MFGNIHQGADPKIELGHNLGCKLVAEGIEDRNTWELLSRLGCDNAQGFCVSPPLPAAEMDAWLKESPWRPAPGSHGCHSPPPFVVEPSGAPAGTPRRDKGGD